VWEDEGEAEERELIRRDDVLKALQTFITDEQGSTKTRFKTGAAVSF
jgi:hypothetical protein